MALLLTCGDGEERGEVYGCAADRQQASIVFEVAADMVRMCPALNKRVKILASQKRIVYQSTNSFYQVLSAEAYSKHGFNIHGVVFDELHTQPNRKLFDVMTKGSGDARTQPLYFLITTAGTDTNSICYETHQKAKDIIEGRKIDPTFYPVIYGAEETDDWTDPKVWKKANPSLGITVSIDKVQAACDSAKQNPGEENAFRQLRLNQWVKQAVRWMPMDKWDACNFHVNEDDLEGRVCYGGLDLSSTTDITAFVLVFPPMDEDDKRPVSDYNSDEMEECTDAYAEFVMEQYEEAKKSCKDPVILIEQKLDFSCYVPEGFGTGDCIIISDDKLHIIDFKYGQGIFVEAEHNP